MKYFIFLIASLLSVSSAWTKDHTEYVKGPFQSPQEVTENCLSCHQDAAQSVMKTTHWTWLSAEAVKIPGHEKPVQIGKRNLFNNFCINLNSNWPRCTSCHAGYGWKDATFDFSNEKNVDCLICHDQTGTYKKSPAGAGYPDPKVDLLKVARHVGPPTRQACGNCHFYGGGGENVKHGDLEPGLVHEGNTLDVHMGKNNMSCTDCHITEKHRIKGIATSVSPVAGERQVECTQCHTDAPHESDILNSHFERVACQTCHIPTFAKELPTKIYWDWSQAGQDRPATKDQYGKETFNKKKGSFKWAQNIQPQYMWYNGTTARYLLGDKVSFSGVNRLNYPLGNKDDGKSRIYPFKVMRGKQIADAENNYLIVPHLWGGYWKHFNWDQAAREGMKTVHLPYSGKYAFVETVMYWRVNHEVTEKQKALQCLDCHGEQCRLNWQALGYQGSPVSRQKVEELMR